MCNSNALLIFFYLKLGVPMYDIDLKRDDAILICGNRMISRAQSCTRVDSRCYDHVYDINITYSHLI